MPWRYTRSVINIMKKSVNLRWQAREVQRDRRKGERDGKRKKEMHGFRKLKRKADKQRGGVIRRQGHGRKG